MFDLNFCNSTNPATFYLNIFKCFVWIIQEEYEIVFLLSMKSGSLLSECSISTCTKYHISFIVPTGVYWMKNNVSFYLIMLLWLIDDGSVVVFLILGLSLIKYLNIHLAEVISLWGWKDTGSILLLVVLFNLLETLDFGPKSLLLLILICKIF